MIGRLEADIRVQSAVVAALGGLAASVIVFGLSGRRVIAAVLAFAVGSVVAALLLIVLRRLRFIVNRLRLIHPGAVPAASPPPAYASPAEVLRRAVPRVSTATSEELPFDPGINRIWWYVPGFGVGSGGHATILAMVAGLERLGARSTVVLTDVEDPDRLRGTRAAMCANYTPTFAEVVARRDARPALGDIVMATDWRSVSAVVEDRNHRRGFYFVQDHEVEFTATGTWSTLAAQTYVAGLRPVTVGPALAEFVRERYEVDASWVPLAVDPGVYGPEDPSPSAVVADVRRANPEGLPVLLVYGRQGTARRGVELALAGLELASRRGASFLCVLFGEDVALHDVSFPWLSVGVLPGRELAALYRTADLGIVLSLTNPSLVPQEMLACGLPVLEAETLLTRRTFGGLPGCHLVPPHPEDLADAIIGLLDADSARMTAPAVVPTHAEAAAGLFCELIGAPVPDGPASLVGIPSVTVAIPTLDPDPVVFSRLLDALDAQRYPGRVELRVIDSGSQQPIEELLAGHRWPVHLHRTTKAEFRHGPTRNLLIEWSDTDLVALLTQDAVPVGDRWLFDLVAACTVDDRIGGAFSRHRPPVDAPRVAAVELVEHHDRLSGLHPSPATPRTAPIATDVHDAQFFFSNNGSILRRAAWEQVPFRDVAFGEDQVWARDALRAGWSINYARHSIVEHLNVFTEAEEEDRAAVVHAWRLKYWAEPRESAAIEARAAHELERAHRVVAEYGLDDRDLATEIRAVRARERGWRRALAAAGSGEEWFQRL